MKKIRLQTTATIEETFADFLVSKRAMGLKDKTLDSYQNHFLSAAKHLDIGMDIALLQKADLEEMITSMREAGLSANSINSYTRTLKTFFSWCNNAGIGIFQISNQAHRKRKSRQPSGCLHRKVQ